MVNGIVVTVAVCDVGCGVVDGVVGTIGCCQRVHEGGRCRRCEPQTARAKVFAPNASNARGHKWSVAWKVEVYQVLRDGRAAAVLVWLWKVDKVKRVDVPFDFLVFRCLVSDKLKWGEKWKCARNHLTAVRQRSWCGVENGEPGLPQVMQQGSDMATVECVCPIFNRRSRQ
eukprot:1945403-Amphidinium_carterae.2